MVLLICDQDDESHGAAQVIAEQVEDFRTMACNQTAVKTVEKFKPYVLLFALKDVASAVKFYSEMVKDDRVNYPHEAILLCQNRESGAAFRCCYKGLFNDYFVYKPMFENYRLKMIVHNALLRCGKELQYEGIKEEHFGRIDQELKKIIDDAVGLKHDTEHFIKEVRHTVAQHHAQPAELLSHANSEQIMQSLEDDLKARIDGMVEQLVAQKISQQQADIKFNQARQTVHPAHSKHDKHGYTPAQPGQSNPYNSYIEPVASDEIHAHSAGEEAEQTETVKKRLLVVEDNDIYREMITRILTKADFDVIAASDGVEALNLIKQYSFDLIFMDLFMPELDGLNTTKRIRELIGEDSPPVIALTSNHNKDLIRRWASHGLQGYLVKPSSKAEILKAADKVLFNTD